MKTAMYVTKKLIMKVVTLVALSVLALFTFIFNFLMAFYRLIAVPAAAILLIAVVINYFDVGFASEQLFFLAMSVFLVGLKYVLPAFSPVLEYAIDSMKFSLFTPILVKSPVKFTM